MNDKHSAAGGFSLFARYTLILSIVVAAVFSVMFGCEPARFIMALVVVLFLDTVFLIYSFICRDSLFVKAGNYILVSACYLIGVGLTFIYGVFLSVPVFIVIPCIAVIFTNAGIGIVSQAILMSLFAFLHGGINLEIAEIFVIGVFLCLMITLAGSVPSLIVSIVLCPVLDLCVRCALNGFNLDEALSFDFYIMAAADLVILLTAFICHRFLLKDLSVSSYRDFVFDLDGAKESQHDVVPEAATAAESESSGFLPGNAGSGHDDLEKSEVDFDLEGFAAVNQEKKMTANDVLSDVSVIHAEEPDLAKSREDAGTFDVSELISNYEISIGACISEDFPYVKLLRGEHPKLYRHCIEVAEYASYAADLIGCDKTLAYAYGLYHEVKRVHAIEDELYSCLFENYHLPHLFLKSLVDYSEKRKMPMLREVGIAALADDVLTMRNYLLARNEEINGEKVVANVIRVRKNQKLIEYCGLSETELEIVSEYLRQILLV